MEEIKYEENAWNNKPAHDRLSLVLPCRRKLNTGRGSVHRRRRFVVGVVSTP
jgi:hypothetical protein